MGVVTTESPQRLGSEPRLTSVAYRSDGSETVVLIRSPTSRASIHISNNIDGCAPHLEPQFLATSLTQAGGGGDGDANGVARYDSRMSRQVEKRPERTPVLRKAAAGLVILAVAALVVHIALHLILGVFFVVVGLVAVVAVLWALNAIL
jgi:hypothetical protein